MLKLIDHLVAIVFVGPIIPLFGDHINSFICYAGLHERVILEADSPFSLVGNACLHSIAVYIMIRAVAHKNIYAVRSPIGANAVLMIRLVVNISIIFIIRVNSASAS